jgi:hypothetical protein
MTSSISWIDRDGLAQTLARMGRHGRLATARPVRREAESAGTGSPEPGAVLSLRPFAAPSGSLRQRLDAFLDWLSGLASGQASFVVDRDGLPLVDRHADADLLAIASSVMHLIGRMNGKTSPAIGQAVAVQLEVGQLVLLTAATPIGEYVVGYVGREIPNRATQQLAADALRRAFRPADTHRVLG